MTSTQRVSGSARRGQRHRAAEMRVGSGDSIQGLALHRAIVRRRMAARAVETSTRCDRCSSCWPSSGSRLAAWVWQPWRSEPPIRAPTGAFVPSGPDGRALLWAVGDGADGSVRAQRVVTRMRRKRFDRVLYLGDVYGAGLLSFLRGDGTEADYRKRYEPVYGDFASRTAPTPGNHEWPQRGDGYEPYWAEVHGEPPPAYYGFRVAGWQLLSLNSEAPHGASSGQVRWLRAQVRRPGTCRLAFWHRPRFSAGQARRRAATSHRCGMRCAAAPAIVVNGHDHNMQRFKAVDGITQYVSGAGGHGLYRFKRRDPRLAFGESRAYGALRIELRPGSARLAFVSSGGKVLDVSVVRCEDRRLTAAAAGTPRSRSAVVRRRSVAARRGSAALVAGELARRQIHAAEGFLEPAHARCRATSLRPGASWVR